MSPNAKKRAARGRAGRTGGRPDAPGRTAGRTPRWLLLVLGLAALAAGGGLGRFIVDGFAKRDQGELLMGAVLVAVLAVGAEAAFTRLQHRFDSPDPSPGGNRSV